MSKTDSTSEVQATVKQINAKRGDFIHGANWAQKELRAAGKLNHFDQLSQDKIYRAAAERHPYPANVVVTGWGSVVGNADGSVTVNVDASDKESITYSAFEVRVIQLLNNGPTGQVVTVGERTFRRPAYAQVAVESKTPKLYHTYGNGDVKAILTAAKLA